MKRFPVKKYKSAKKFNKQSAKTKAANVRPVVMRGGIRF